jgi:hypothetical protein
MLMAWRSLAEAEARLRHTGLAEAHPIAALLPNEHQIDNLGNENLTIGDALSDSCVQALWGTATSDAARDLLVEITRNAFTHGGATHVQLAIGAGSISLHDNGGAFNPLELAALDGRGGAAAVRTYIQRHSGRSILAWHRVHHGNEFTIGPLPPAEALERLATCAIDLRKKGRWEPIQRERLAGCRVVYVVLPKYCSPSDVYMLREHVLPSEQGQIPVFLLSEASEGVRTLLLEVFPKCQCVEL